MSATKSELVREKCQLIAFHYESAAVAEAMTMLAKAHKEEEEGSHKLADEGSKVGLDREWQAFAHAVGDAAFFAGVEGALMLPGGTRWHREGEVWVKSWMK